MNNNDNSRSVAYEATMKNGRQVILHRNVIAELVEREDGTCNVRTKGGSFYDLSDKYEDVMDWLDTGVVNPVGDQYLKEGYIQKGEGNA